MPYRRYITAAVLMALAFLAGTLYNQQNVNGHSETSKRRILYYHDPMHPSYRSDKPGVAPDCGMQLQPVYVDTPEKGLHINAEKQQLIGIKVGHVETTPAPQSIRSAGRVAVDETRLYRLNAATDGWIHETQSNSVGSLVRKDQSLVTYYTRELRSAVQAYFYVLDRMQAPETPSGTVDAGLDRRGLELALEGLRNLGHEREPDTGNRAKVAQLHNTLYCDRQSPVLLSGEMFLPYSASVMEMSYTGLRI